MADTLTSLADLVLINNQNLADLNVTDLVQDANILAALHAQPASNGTIHEYLKETGAPVVGFRDANDGRDLSTDTDENVTLNLQILSASHRQDMALAMKYKDGESAFMARKTRRHLKAAFKQAELQLVNGVGNDAKGFNGLVDALNDVSMDTVYDANPGANPADNLTSIYFITTSEDDCSVIGGNDGQITVAPYRAESAQGANGTFESYFQPILGWLGLQVGSKWSIVRICNVAGQNVNMADDDLLYKGLDLLPEGHVPNLCVMNKRSRGQIRDARTATNNTGVPAPYPRDIEDIPIITSSSILNNEATVT